MFKFEIITRQKDSLEEMVESVACY